MNETTTWRQQNCKADQSEEFHIEGVERMTGLQQIERVLQELANGNFKARVKLSGSDEHARLAQLVNAQADYVSDMFAELVLDVTRLVHSALQEGDELNLISANFVEQADSLTQISASTTELSTTIHNVADATSHTSQEIHEGQQTVLETEKQVTDSAKRIQEAQGQLEQLTANMQELDQAGKQIGNLVNIIKNVSDQTNLLALNAAIEAARAGEHGRGFGVVANEVRALADQSRQSVGQITSQVGTIQKQVESIAGSFRVMESLFSGNVEAAYASSISVSKLTGVFEKIGQVIETVAPVAATYEEVNQNLAETNASIEEVREHLQSCNQNLYQVISEADGLRGKIGSVQIVQTAKNIIELSKVDHLLWKSRIEYMLKGIVHLNPVQVEDHHICRLGKWYFGPGKEMYGDLEVFRNMDSYHEQFHKVCAETIRMYQRGEHEAARRQMARIEELSQIVMRMLDELKSKA